MNVFFAVQMPEEAQARLQELADAWRAAYRGRASWYQPADYHLTLKFLGDQPPERMEEWREQGALAAAQSGPVTIRPAAPGAFPSVARPSVLWGGVDDDPALTALAGVIDHSCAPVGVARERRPFRPHITLARVRSPAPADPPDWTRTFEPFPAIHFVLMETLTPEQRRNRANLRYNIVQTFPLGEKF